jgi:molybdate-binding protein/DNA-binding XRE family transcriptional regulator
MKQEGSLHNSLKATRTRLGLSQQDLAQAAGVTRQTVGGIEVGMYAPSATVALRLARALGCRVEDLFWLEQDLPAVEALAAEGMPAGGPTRVSLAQIGGRWVAHPLLGDEAFRLEMVPTDGIGAREPEARSLRVQLLDDPASLARTVVLAGCTPALSLWARAAERWYPGLRVHWTFANSMLALRALSRGEVHAAGLHLYDAAADDYNTPYVRQMMGGRPPFTPVVLINLGVWEEGLVVPPGNPRRLSRAADLTRPGIRLVNREEGAGARLLLEQLLQQDGVPPAQVSGFDRVAYSHLEVAREVAAGRADAGVSTASVAAAYGLGFVPLRAVRYDLALLKDTLEHEPVRQLLGTLDHRWVRTQLNALVGYNTAHTGEIVAEVARVP